MIPYFVCVSLSIWSDRQLLDRPPEIKNSPLGKTEMMEHRAFLIASQNYFLDWEKNFKKK